MLRDYYELAKPGIVYGNAVTTLAAFLYASRWQFSVGLFLATMVGIMLVIGSACVFNNYLDRDIDAKMTRTKARALASGKIGGMSALTYASALGVLGLVLLYVYTNALTAVIALSGWILYVLVYTPAKRRTPFATLIGAVPGAVPIVVGYTAALGRFDLPAIVLFFSLVLWQMPHFYAIALYRKEEYAAAGIPTMAARVSAARLKTAIVLYIIIFTWELSLLYWGGLAGAAYLGLVLILGLYWLSTTLTRWRLPDAAWGRSVFLASLITLLVFCLALSTAPLLP